MTDKEILQKVIEKALAGGYNALHVKEFGVGHFASLMMGDEYALAGWLHSHEFAKAFWGDKYINVEYQPASSKQLGDAFLNVTVSRRQRAWRAHLQNMVLEENPIKYLEKFL